MQDVNNHQMDTMLYYVQSLGLVVAQTTPQYNSLRHFPPPLPQFHDWPHAL
jgi:hypothetical protein